MALLALLVVLLLVLSPFPPTSVPEDLLMPWTCPLPPEQCKDLTDCLQNCADFRAYLAQLEAAGLPVREWQEDNEQTARMAAELKRIHFPDQP